MKEFTIEQKAQRYDKALEKAKEVYTYYCDDTEQLRKIESIFPELKESVDEIRKDIIKFTKKRDRSGCDYDYDKWIAGLEKQGEKKHKFNIGDIISNGNVTYRVDNIVKNCIGQDCYFLVNIERENKRMRYIRLTNSQGKTYNFGELTWLCEQVDAKFEKQGEQKFSWSENDEGYMDRILEALYDYYPKRYAQSIYDWLEKSMKGE